MAKTAPVYREIWFNSLAPELRNRFIQSIGADDFPRPLMKAAATGYGWPIALQLICLFPLAMVLGTQRPATADGLFFLGLILMANFACALWFYRRIKWRRASPFPPGSYWYPLDVVETFADGRLRLWPAGAMKDFGATHHHTNGIYSHTAFTLRFPGKKFEFTLRGKQDAEMILQNFQGIQQAIQKAVQENNPRTFHAFDPFADLRLRDAWAGVCQPPGGTVIQPRVEPMPSWLQSPLKAWGAGLAGGLVFAAAAAPLVNLVNDYNFYRYAQSTDQAAVWREYIHKGWLHKDEARKQLPVAVLREAHDSVSGLRAFTQEFRGHELVPQAQSRIHELYERSLKRLAGRADPAMFDFLQDLFAWMETHPQPLQLRFMPPATGGMEEVDASIAANGKMHGFDIAPISPSFTEKSNQARESAIVQSLQKGFIGVVPAEILKVSGGPRYADGKVGEATQPEVGIAYMVAPSGDMYSREGTKDGYVGIVVHFQVFMRVPQSQRMHQFKFDALPPDHFTVDHRGASVSDATVYDVMAREAFARLDGQLRRAFFNPEDQPAQPGAAAPRAAAPDEM